MLIPVALIRMGQKIAQLACLANHASRLSTLETTHSRSLCRIALVPVANDIVLVMHGSLFSRTLDLSVT